jgi:bacteriorhodopsin
MAPLPEGTTYGQFLAVYNALSFGIAGMGSATIFLWLQMPQVQKKYRTALAISGLVTAIACYHYVRIFNSWEGAFNVSNSGTHFGAYEVSLTGEPFNDAYRYVDWLLTVPLLLIELLCVMDLPADELASKGFTLGLAAAVMVGLGYPGEIQDDQSQRFIWWFMSMIPFCYVVYSLVVGLEAATTAPVNAPAAGMIANARYLTVISWCTYPAVYMVKALGIAGASASAAEQIGYSIADIVAKAVFGVFIYCIAAAKSAASEGKQPLLA